MRWSANPTAPNRVTLPRTEPVPFRESAKRSLPDSLRNRAVFFAPEAASLGAYEFRIAAKAQKDAIDRAAEFNASTKDGVDTRLEGDASFATSFARTDSRESFRSTSADNKSELLSEHA